MRLVTFAPSRGKPRAGALIERDSTIDLYAFDRRYVRLGFTREF